MCSGGTTARLIESFTEVSIRAEIWGCGITSGQMRRPVARIWRTEVGSLDRIELERIAKPLVGAHLFDGVSQVVWEGGASCLK